MSHKEKKRTYMFITIGNVNWSRNIIYIIIIKGKELFGNTFRGLIL